MHEFGLDLHIRCRAVSDLQRHGAASRPEGLSTTARSMKPSVSVRHPERRNLLTMSIYGLVLGRAWVLVGDVGFFRGVGWLARNTMPQALAKLGRRGRRWLLTGRRWLLLAAERVFSRGMITIGNGQRSSSHIEPIPIATGESGEQKCQAIDNAEASGDGGGVERQISDGIKARFELTALIQLV
jgi:hypothetical protein